MYKEGVEATKKNKQDYLLGIIGLTERFKEDARKERKQYWSKLISNREDCRADFKRILGKPIDADLKSDVLKTEREFLFNKDGYSAYRIKFGFSNGCNLSGLFFEKSKKKMPLIILQHGLLGSPEIMTGIYGETYNYNDILKTVSEFDANVFCPQLLLWDSNMYDVPYDREKIDDDLKRVGSSIAAVEISFLISIIDWFEKSGKVSSFGMIGLSYGAFYALTLAAVDTRIKSIMACAFFHNADKLYFKRDLMWKNSLKYFSFAEIASLICPRKLYLLMGDRDELFGKDLFYDEIDNLEKIFKNSDKSWYKYSVFNGGHEFFADKDMIKDLINDLC